MKKLMTIYLFMLFSLMYTLALSQEANTGDQKGWIGGRVIWNGHDLRKASVQLFKDQKLRDLYINGVILDPDGIYALEIEEPGTYYLSAFVDDNNSKSFDTGDGMGIYGVTDWSDLNQKAVPIKIDKNKKLLNIDVEITAIVNERGQVVPISSNLSHSKTGVAGKIILPDYKFKNTIVYAYSDPLWNNKVAQTDVSENGEFILEIPAGKYYLMVVIDENNSNKLDIGDKFGIWGMTRFGMYPKPIQLREGNFRTERNILIIGKIDENGKPVPLINSANEKDIKQEESVNLSGSVIWVGNDVKNSVIQAYVDPSLTIAIAKAVTDNKGNFSLNVPIGEYYLTAGVDLDGDGKYTKGDGIGIYGTIDAVNDLPQKLIVTKESSKEHINLVISAKFNDNGQLITIPYNEQTESEDNETTNQIDTSEQATGIAGKIIWTDHKLSNVILIFSEDPSFDNGVKVPLKLSEDGVYACSSAPGVHFLMAIVDNDGNDQADTGDGIGFYGTGYLGNGRWGTPQTVTVIENYITPYINISITAILDADKKPIMTRDGIKLYYGEPNNIFNTDENTLEWWYWSKGVAFTFSKTDGEWLLADIYEFTPKEMQSERLSHEKGIIYYTYEDNIWSVNPDGSNRNRIANGRSVTGTFEGDRLLFLDSYTGLSMYIPYNQTLTELNWKYTGSQQALSNDGKKVAFTREIGGRKQISILNIETGAEVSLPGANLELSCPAWSPDGELLAYSASLPLSSQKEKPNKDIYYYDIISGRTERVSSSPYDESDPAWSPSSNARMLVFSREEGDHSQLWIVRFDENGRPSEHQLTKRGGKNPAWSPNGDMIVYENNAQLWIIKPDGRNETPILLNNEPIFGLDPFWTK